MSKPKRKSRVWFAFKVLIRTVIATALIVALALAVAFSYVTRPEVLAQIVKDEISKRMNAPMSIGAISIALDGSIVIDDVAIAIDPGQDFYKSNSTQPTTLPATQPANLAATHPGTDALPPDSGVSEAYNQPDSQVEQRASRLLRIRRIVIKENPTTLLTGHIDVKSIIISRPTLYVVENLDTHQYNIQRLKFRSTSATPSAPGGPPDVPSELPPVTIEGARVFSGVVENGRYRHVGIMRLRGDLWPNPAAPGTYQFEVEQYKNLGKNKNVQIQGYFNPEKLVVAGSVRGFSLALKSSIAEFLPEEYRRSWEQFKPEGELSHLNFNYSPASGVGASLGLVKGAVTLEFDKIVRRIDEVDLKVNFQKDKLTVEEFHGRIGNVTYEIAGVLNGLSRNSPFEMRVQLNPFVIPENPEELDKFPAIVQKYYARLKPSGTFSARLNLQRKAVGAPIDYEGSVRISNAKITYADFAYPIQNVYGDIIFSNAQARIEKMTGTGLSGAKLQISGYFRPPGDGAEVELNIIGSDIPLDDHLRGAFGPQTLGIYDMVRERSVLASLIDKKIIPAGPDGKPVFTLDGKGNMVTRVRREFGERSEYKTTVTINAKGAKALFKYWPYPVELTDGVIIVSPPVVSLNNVKFISPTGATGVINGDISGGTGPNDPLKPNLTVHVEKMPIEPMFLASIPPDYSEFISSMAMTGDVGVDGRIFYDPTTKAIDFRLDTTIKNGTANPNNSGYKLDSFEGEAIVSSHGVEFKEIRGIHNKTRFSLIGEAEIVDKKQKSRMYVEFFDLDLAEPFWELIPKTASAGQAIKESLERFKLKGHVNGRLYAQNTKPDESPLSGRIEPDSLSLVYAGDTIDCTKMSGGIDFDLDQLQFDRLAMNIGFTQAEVRGNASLKKIGDFDLHIDAKGPNLIAPTSYLIPKGLRGAIDSIELRTGFDISDASFKGVRRDDGKVDLALAGQADLRNTSIRIGTPIVMPKARVQAVITYANEMTLAQSQIRVTAPAMTMLGRAFDNLNIDTATTGKDSVLYINKVRAGLYDGNLTVAGTYETTGQQKFDLNLVLDNARLDPVLSPARKPDPVAAAPDNGGPAPIIDVLKAGTNAIDGVMDLGNKALHDATKAADKAAQTLTPGSPATTASDDTPIAPDPRGTPNDARVSAAMNVKGQAASIKTYSGKGTIVAKGLDSKAMPAAMAVFHLINLRLPDAESFRQMNAKARLDGRIIWLDDIKLASPSIELIGSGAINWKNQAIDFRLTTQAPAALNVPFLTTIADILRNQIISIRVDGTFAKPYARLQPLAGIVKVFEGNTTVDDDEPEGRDN